MYQNMQPLENVFLKHHLSNLVDKLDKCDKSTFNRIYVRNYVFQECQTKLDELVKNGIFLQLNVNNLSQEDKTILSGYGLYWTGPSQNALEI